MIEVKTLLWTGGDAPSREAELKVGQHDEINHCYAYYEPGYCGCEDCSPLVGDGATAEEAVADYWERWEAKYGSAN